MQLASGVTNQYFQTTNELTSGLFYKFKVISRNSVGFSVDSQEVEILAAVEPDAPINLVNDASVTNAYQVRITWSNGAYNGANSIIDYQVSFKVLGDADYQIFSTDQTTREETITGLTPGVQYQFVV